MEVFAILKPGLVLSCFCRQPLLHIFPPFSLQPHFHDGNLALVMGYPLNETEKKQLNCHLWSLKLELHVFISGSLPLLVMAVFVYQSDTGCHLCVYDCVNLFHFKETQEESVV